MILADTSISDRVLAKRPPIPRYDALDTFQWTAHSESGGCRVTMRTRRCLVQWRRQIQS